MAAVNELGSVAEESPQETHKSDYDGKVQIVSVESQLALKYPKIDVDVLQISRWSGETCPGGEYLGFVDHDVDFICHPCCSLSMAFARQRFLDLGQNLTVAKLETSASEAEWLEVV